MTTGEFIVLGAAHWHAPWHLRSLEEAGQRVVGVSDPSDGARRALSERHNPASGLRGPEIPDYDSWQAAMDEHPKAIPVVLTPPALTPAVLDRIVNERRPFVLEKPGTINAQALAPFAGSAAAWGIPSLVPFVNRYADFWRELEKTDLRETWTHAHFRIHAGPPQRYLRDGVPWVLEPQSYGGGALRNLGVHAADAIADLLRGLAGPQEISVRSAQISHSLHGLAVEDLALATLVTADGRTVTIEAGYTMPAEKAADKEWRIHGPGASVAEANGVVTVRDASGARSWQGAPSSNQYLAFGHTMARLANGDADFAGVQELLIAQRLVDRLYSVAEEA